MRFFVSLIFPFLILFACNRNGVVKSNIGHPQDSIRKILEKQQVAWNNGSIDSFMLGYWKSDSLRFIGKKGIRFGYDSICASYKKYYNSRGKMGKLSFSELQFTEMAYSPEVSNVTGRWKISGTDSSGGFFSLIFMKKKGEWKIVTDHTW